jgi:hypothetical protein
MTSAQPTTTAYKPSTKGVKRSIKSPPLVPIEKEVTGKITAMAYPSQVQISKAQEENKEVTPPV